MARGEIPLSDLQKMADSLQKAVDRIRESVQIAEKANLEEPMVHGSAVANTYLPYISAWATKLRIEIEIQADSSQAGQKSIAARDRDRYRTYQQKKREKK